MLRQAWESFGGYLLADYPPDQRPWGWWRFEPGIPADLRGGRPALYPLEEAERVRQEQEDLEARRAQWLAAHHEAEAHEAHP